MRHKRPRSANNGHNVKTEKEGSGVTLGKLHPYIVCRLCRGYIVNCVTIVECMHSFCRSCIIKYLNDLDERYECPKCGQIIHETNPWNYLAPDSALQTIIYKLVPGLQETESRRCLEYYKRRGVSPPRKERESLLDFQEKETHRFKKQSSTAETKNGSDPKLKTSDNDNHRLDEQISIQLISWQVANAQGEETAPVRAADGKLFRPFLRLSCFATVNHLRKYLAYRLHGNIDRYADFELYCEGRPLYKEHTLKFIAATVWGRIVEHSEKDIDLVMPIVYNNNRAAARDGTDDGAEEEEDGMSNGTAATNNSNSVSSPI